MQKLFLKVCFFVLLLVQLLSAHPHLFVKPSIAVKEIKNNQIVFKITWEWDQWWSEDIIRACDQNKDGILDSKDNKLVYRDFFKNTRNYHYFTWIKLNNEYKSYVVRDFKASINERKIVVYEFELEIEFDESTTTKPYKMTVIFNDKSIYTAFDDKILVNDPKGKDNYHNIKFGTQSFYGVKIDFVYSSDK